MPLPIQPSLAQAHGILGNNTSTYDKGFVITPFSTVIGVGKGPFIDKMTAHLDAGADFFSRSVGAGLHLSYYFAGTDSLKVNTQFIKPSLNFNLYQSGYSSVGSVRDALVLTRLSLMLGSTKVSNLNHVSEQSSFTYGMALDFFLSGVSLGTPKSQIAFGMSSFGLGIAFYKMSDAPYDGFNKELRFICDVGGMFLGVISK